MAAVLTSMFSGEEEQGPCPCCSNHFQQTLSFLARGSNEMAGGELGSEKEKETWESHVGMVIYEKRRLD
jgi:hypothetical protein